MIWCQHNGLVFEATHMPMEKTHQVVWDILIDYRRLEWQSILLDLEKAPGVAYEDALRELGEV